MLTIIIDEAMLPLHSVIATELSVVTLRSQGVYIGLD